MKLLLYCTKAKPYLVKVDDNEFDITNDIYDNRIQWDKKPISNGKIVAECDFKVEYINILNFGGFIFNTNTISYRELLANSCLSSNGLESYLGNKDGFAIQIKKLHIFDKPRELSYYYRYCPCSYNPLQPIKVAPQNMMYAYNFKDYDEKPEYILISIQPQWLCKILNGEKTIEVRKKVLKEMI